MTDTRTIRQRVNGGEVIVQATAKPGRITIYVLGRDIQTDPLWRISTLSDDWGWARDVRTTYDEVPTIRSDRSYQLPCMSLTLTCDPGCREKAKGLVRAAAEWLETLQRNGATIEPDDGTVGIRKVIERIGMAD